MNISAQVINRPGDHQVVVKTNDNAQSIAIAPKSSGMGSSVNGGELLFLALATCYCNDLYREAAQRGIAIEQVEVQVTGGFGAPGEPAKNVTYRARVKANAGTEEIHALMEHTDRVAEIQNTLRGQTPVTFDGGEVIVG